MSMSYFGAPEDEPGYWDDKCLPNNDSLDYLEVFSGRGCKEYRCNLGWLPTDGIPDEIVMDGEWNEHIPVSLLFPTEFHACVCNPLWSGVGEEVGV